MHSHRRSLRAALAFAFLPFAAFAASADAARVAVVHNPAPAYPAALFAASVNQGHAIVACTIGDDGSVLDLWTIESSNAAFADAAEGSLREWRYQATPAANAPGAVATVSPAAPWPRTDLIRFNFFRTGHITTLTHIGAFERAFGESAPASTYPGEFPLVPLAKLKKLEGSAPAPTPGVPAGRVLVEFLVDAEGRVRVPLALSAEHRAHAESALAAVRAWRFAPTPTDRASSTVRVRIGFRFPARGA